jgi:hypothetical protein
MTIDPDVLALMPAISAGASCAAALVALANVVVTNGNAKRARALDLLHKKEQEFDSERMRKTRRRAAAELLSKSDATAAVDEVLDFMEGLSRMVVEGDLPADLAWHSFYHWYIRYFYATIAIRSVERKRDPSIWESIEQMQPLMKRLQRKHGTRYAFNAPSDIQKFLASEAAAAAAAENT